MLALFLGGLLVMLPLMVNSRTVVQTLIECGTAPLPITEEEEVKHSCSINWHQSLYAATDLLSQGTTVPALEDRYNEVDHGEVAVPPPKR